MFKKSEDKYLNRHCYVSKCSIIIKNVGSALTDLRVAAVIYFGLLFCYFVGELFLLNKEYNVEKIMQGYQKISYYELFEDLQEDEIVQEILVNSLKDRLVVTYEGETKLVENVTADQFTFDFIRYVDSNNSVMVTFDGINNKN